MCFGKSNVDATVNAQTDEQVENGAIASGSGEAGPYVSPVSDCASLHRAAQAGLGAQAATQEAQPAPSAFDRSFAAFQALKARQILAFSLGEEVSAEEKAQHVTAVIEPYYIGNGDVDHVGIINALEAFKGRPLSQEELRVWGRAVGAYCVQRGVQELRDALTSGKRETVRDLLGKFL